MTRNEGQQPAATLDKRVHVILRNGFDTRTSPENKSGWFAGGLEGWPKGCRWSFHGDDFDILEWEVIG